MEIINSIVNIANEDKKLQTPADIIPLYARKILNISVERKYSFFTLKLDFDVA
jgi:predicted PolB exonuclease-like 3'-5' exonuclease